MTGEESSSPESRGLYSDPEAFSRSGPHYVAVVRQDGSEMIVSTIDAKFYIALTGAEVALQRVEEPGTRVLIIDADTNRAVRCFEKGKGPLPDWSEDDPGKARRRASARAAGEAIVEHP